MNILVLQIEDRNIPLLNTMMNENKNICLKNNFKYVNLKKSTYDIPPYWAKVFEIYKIMMSKVEVSHIMWMDSDAMFYNFDKQKIIKLLNKHSKYSMIITKDMPPWEEGEFNSGVFIIKNDKIGLDIIKKWMKLYDPDKWFYFDNEWFTESDWASEDYEQGAFIRYIYSDANYMKYIKQLPFYILNNNNCSDNNMDIIVSHLANYHKNNKVNIDNCIASINNNNFNLLLLIVIIIIFFILRSI